MTFVVIGLPGSTIFTFMSRQNTRDEDIEPFVQLWFAGNHSDIGGSYPETESRLSDIALKWMIDEARSLPDPLKIDDTKLNIFQQMKALTSMIQILKEIQT